MLKEHMGIKRYHVVSINEGESKTQQHFKDESDINNIVNRFKDTEIIDHLNSTPLNYGDASAQTFTEAMFTVTQATEEFMQLPSDVRKHFKNDVALFLDASTDPEQKAFFQEHGMLPADPDPSADKPPVEPVETPAPAVPTPE